MNIDNIPNSIREAQFEDATAKLFFVPGHGYLLGWGNTVPAAASTGWGKGALFIHRDGSGGDDMLYVNTGSTTSSSFTSQSSVSGSDFGAGGVKADLVDESTAGSGVKVGGTGIKVGFHGTAPAAQGSAYTQTYATADKTHAAPTAATLTVSDGEGTNDNTIGAITADASVIAAVQEIADEINKLVADVADVKHIVNSVIDDLQAHGLVA